MSEIEQDIAPAVQGFEPEAGSENGVMGQMPSVADLIKQDYEELATTREVLIPIKGYERSRISVKYHLPDRGKELDDIGRKVAREFKDPYSRNLYTGVDTMINLCAGLYCQPDGLDEPAELDPDNTGSPVMFDERLAILMGMENVTTARQVVRRLFGNNDMAVLNHAERLNRWLLDTKADLEREMWQVGE